MALHLQRAVDHLKKGLLSLCAIVEENVHNAVKALDEGDETLAQKVISTDIEIDHMEIQLEEEGLQILALHQPVAIDLRFIVAVLKINADLERIGDMAVNIAEHAAFLATQDAIDVPLDFSGMMEKTKAMLRKSLDALVRLDCRLAREVCAEDDDVDAMNREMYDQVRESLMAHPNHFGCLIHLLQAARHLERIADHATNIAQDVVYMVEGEIVRHRPEDYEHLAEQERN